jgi:hypothetical protein
MSQLLDEAELRADLNGLTNSTPPAMSEIDRRARQVRRLRRQRMVGVAASAGAVLVLAAAGGMRIIGWEPRPNGEVPICSLQQLPSSGWSFGLSPAELPAEMRLAWSPAAGPSAAYANARREEQSCAYPPMFRLVDRENGQVRRSAELQAYPIDDGSVESPAVASSAAAVPSDIEVINAGDQGPVTQQVGWRQRGYSYEVDTWGFSRSQTEDLLAHLQVQAGNFDVSRWPALSEFEEAGTTPLPTDGVSYTWTLSSEVPDDVVVPLTVDVIESSEPLAMRASAGDRWVTVAGEPALQEQDGAVMWKPTPDTFAFVHGTLSAQRLLEIAQTVGPHPADEFDDISAF